MNDSKTIIKAYASRDNVLFKTADRYLYIAGKNSRNTGLESTNIILDEREEVIRFVAHKDRVFIYTNTNCVVSCYYSKPETLLSNDNDKLDVDPDDTSDMLGTLTKQDLLAMPFEPGSQNPHRIKVDMNQISAWKALTQTMYDALPSKDKHIYLESAKVRLQQDIQDMKPWTSNEDIVSLVLEQISKPVEHSESEDEDDSDNETFGTLIPSVPIEYNTKPIATSISEITSPEIQPFEYSSQPHFVSLLRPILYSNVKSVVFGLHANFYQINDKIILEVFDFIDSDENSGHYADMPLKLYNQFDNCYEICPPFINPYWIFKQDFIYHYDHGTHHVLIPHFEDFPFCWIFFQCDFEINPDSIYWSSTLKTIYVVHQDIIWMYNLLTKRLEPLLSCQIQHFFTRGHHSSHLILSDSANIYVHGIWHYIQGTNSDPNVDLHSHICSKMIDIHHHDAGNHNAIIIFDDPSMPRLHYSPDILCLNISGLKYYGSLMNHYTIYIEGSDLHIIAEYDEDLIRKSRDYTQYDYNMSYKIELPFLESEILNCEINDSLAIQTATNYYYICSHDKFEIHRINLHSTLCLRTKPLQLINRCKRLDLGSSSSNINNSGNLTLNLDERAPMKMLDFVRNRHASSYVYASALSSAGETYGGGGKRILFDYTLRKFADMFFIKYNFVSSLQIPQLKSKSCADLNNMGKMLAFAYYNTGKLPIRIPLIIQAAIQRRHPTRLALEFFAQLEDPETYRNLSCMRDSPDALKKSGFNSYEDGLRFICKYDSSVESERFQAHEIARKIADGFIDNCIINNSYQMNLPTLDWCFSGDSIIDIKAFMANVVFHGPTPEQKAALTNCICSLSQQEFRNLLANWCGCSYVLSAHHYRILKFSKTSDRILQFSTCSLEMIVYEGFFSMPQETWPLSLTEECLSVSG